MSDLAVGRPFRCRPGVRALRIGPDSREFRDTHSHTLSHLQRIVEEDPQMWGFPRCSTWGCSLRAEDLEVADVVTCPKCLRTEP